MTCCNTRYATVAETMGHTCPVNPLFARLKALEEDVRVSSATAAMGVTLWDRERAASRRKTAKAELYAMVTQLSQEDAAAYRVYRQR
jgi:hypothetical protein